MAHHFRPLHDRVLLKWVEVEEKTPAGVIIPETAQEKPAEGPSARCRARIDR
jgi:chaperonin GroES